MKVCPSCGKEIEEEASVCPHCGNAVEEAAEESSARGGTGRTKSVPWWAVLLLLGAVCTAGWLYTSNLVDRYSKQVSDAQASIVDLQTQLGDTQVELDDARQTNAELTADLEDAQDAELRVKAVLDDLQAQHTEQAADLEELQYALLCENREEYHEFVPDYSSNSAASAALKTFVEETFGNVVDTGWDVLWSNSGSALHSVINDYISNEFNLEPHQVLNCFVVYRGDPTHDDSVLWLNRQCWLDK
jgi:predicted nuclease with TOPRIM domain